MNRRSALCFAFGGRSIAPVRVVVVSCLLLSVAACSGGSGGPSNDIGRIDGPAVVDQDEGGADNGATDDPSDG